MEKVKVELQPEPEKFYTFPPSVEGRRLFFLSSESLRKASVLKRLGKMIPRFAEDIVDDNKETLQYLAEVDEDQRFLVVLFKPEDQKGIDLRETIDFDFLKKRQSTIIDVMQKYGWFEEENHRITALEIPDQ